MNIAQYRSIGEWYKAVKTEGYSVPVTACHALSQIMKKLNLSFPEAYQLLVAKEKLILVNKTYILDLSFTKLFDQQSSRDF